MRRKAFALAALGTRAELDTMVIMAASEEGEQAARDLEARMDRKDPLEIPPNRRTRRALAKIKRRG